MDCMDFVRPLTVVVFFFVAKNLTDIRISNVKFTLWIAIAYTLVTAVFFTGELLASIIVFVLLFTMIYTNGVKFIMSLVGAMATFIIMIICNTLSGLILKEMYPGIDYYVAAADNFKMFISLLISNSMLSYTLSKTIGFILYKNLKIKTVGSINRSIRIIFFVLTLIVLIFIYYTSLSRDVMRNPDIIYIYLVFCIFLIVIIYFAFNTTLKERKLVNSKNELKHLEEYTANIESMYNDIRSIRHDYANVISSMAGYIEDDDIDGLKMYFKQEIVPFSSRMELIDNNLSVLSKIKEPSLKGIIAVKLIHAQDINITTLLDIRENIHITSINILDLNRIVGILLDNASEAALECEKAFIKMAIVKYNNMLTIVIINSVKNNKININKIFDEGFSTKDLDRGYGLSNVKAILAHYPNVLLDTKVKDKEFSQIIYIEEKVREDNAECLHL